MVAITPEIYEAYKACVGEPVQLIGMLESLATASVGSNLSAGYANFRELPSSDFHRAVQEPSRLFPADVLEALSVSHWQPNKGDLWNILFEATGHLKTALKFWTFDEEGATLLAFGTLDTLSQLRMARHQLGMVIPELEREKNPDDDVVALERVMQYSPETSLQDALLVIEHHIVPQLEQGLVMLLERMPGLREQMQAYAQEQAADGYADYYRDFAQHVASHCSWLMPDHPALRDLPGELIACSCGLNMSTLMPIADNAWVSRLSEGAALARENLHPRIAASLEHGAGQLR